MCRRRAVRVSTHSFPRWKGDHVPRSDLRRSVHVSTNFLPDRKEDAVQRVEESIQPRVSITFLPERKEHRVDQGLTPGRVIVSIHFLPGRKGRPDMNLDFSPSGRPFQPTSFPGGRKTIGGQPPIVVPSGFNPLSSRLRAMGVVPFQSASLPTGGIHDISGTRLTMSLFQSSIGRLPVVPTSACFNPPALLDDLF